VLQTHPPRDIPARLQRLGLHEIGGGLIVAAAGTRRSRGLGLIGLERLPPELGLLIPRCRSVHTFGMRFAIDILFLDATGGVLRIQGNVAPRRLAFCRRAHAVLEAARGAGPRFARETPLRCAAPTSP
jgi:uncharacterized membrane protein (UPF0127 family)